MKTNCSHVRRPYSNMTSHVIKKFKQDHAQKKDDVKPLGGGDHLQGKEKFLQVNASANNRCVCMCEHMSMCVRV